MPDIKELRREYGLSDHEVPVVFELSPSGRKIFTYKGAYICAVGPTGSGKTRTVLEYLHKMALEYPGLRILMGRLYRSSMTQTCMKVFSTEVLTPGDRVRFSPTQQAYLYPPGEVRYGDRKGQRARSEIIVAGLDDPARIMSGQYDIIYINEGTDLTQDQWEMMYTRNRNGMLPYQQMIMDCNPQHPSHWVKKFIDLGKLYEVKSFLHENPKYFDKALGDWTPVGQSYVEKLNHLTGARRRRLFEGEWAAAEGQVYDTFDRGVHVVPNFEPPRSWRRIWSIDFGFTNPFVWQNWAIDEDGRMYLHQELYHTGLRTEQAAALIWDAVQDQPYPHAILCDHDAEGRAVLEKEWGVLTQAAYKSVAEGIQAVQKRLDKVYDGTNMDKLTGLDLGRPRILLMADSLIHPPDDALTKRGLPISTYEETEGYVWDVKNSLEKQKGDVPVKRNDHGMDAERYAVAFEDDLAIDMAEEDVTVALGPMADRYMGVRISPY
jgi:phage terminase large subunit